MKRRLLLTMGKSLIGLFLCMFIAGCGKREAKLLSSTEKATETQASLEESLDSSYEMEEINSTATVCIYICGEVMMPGVYELPVDARICDAVEAAGGFTTEACQTYWNLAQGLTDGEMICVPTVEEAYERGLGENQENEIGSVSSESGITADGRVNINVATIEELMTLPGIGQTRAEQIVAYRQKNGSFSSIEEICKVSGIKDKTFQQLKEYISVK